MRTVEQKLHAVKRQLETGLMVSSEYKDSYINKALVYLREALKQMHEEELDTDRDWRNRVI